MLDDFEANLELLPSGKPAFKAKADATASDTLSASEVLTALMRSLRAMAEHRLIITSRYKVTLPELDAYVARVSVPALSGADWTKKCDRLEAFKAESEVDKDLQQRAKAIANGNPRLLEWLDDVLRASGLDKAAILDAMAAKAAEYRENILAEELLKQQVPAVSLLLARGLIYQLPVPEAALAAVRDGIENFAQHRDRAGALGLLELSQIGGEAHYRVSRLLEALLPREATEARCGTAAETLYEGWWRAAESASEERSLEVHRLAVAGKQADIAADIASRIAHLYYDQSRFREAVDLCSKTLEIGSDYRVYHALARSKQTLGDTQAALQYYNQALEQCPDSNDHAKEKSAIIHNSAGIYAQRGQVQQALDLYQQSLEAEEAIGDVKGKAATLHQMAGIYAQRGQVQQALGLYQQSLEAEEAIGDVKGKAATLNNMAIIYAQQGQVQQALGLYQQSLEAEEAIGNVQGKAATLHCMAIIYAQQGQVQQALGLYQQSLEAEEAIGNVQGQAATLNNMADLAFKAGERDRALDLLKQTVEAVIQSRDYLNGVIVLSNIAATSEDGKIAYFAQSLWLALQIETPLDSLMLRLSSLFKTLPKGDPLELLLATTALYHCAQQSNHPNIEDLQKRAFDMLSYIASARGIETQAALQTWMAQTGLNDPNQFLPQLNQELKARIGDTWLFNPNDLPRP
ncbi:MAG: tetratricopeptide repeat protein [Cyanobacteria bacterium P01_A01_bin.135]